MIRAVRNLCMISIGFLFLIPAGGMGLDILRGVDGVSETEKRVLAGAPSFEGSLRDYTADFDGYLEDNFGFRMAFIRLARKVRDNLGENPPEIVVGKDRWLFIGNNPYRDEFEGNGNWNEAQVDRWIDQLSRLNATLSSEGISFAGFIGVDKSRVFPDKLPDDWKLGERRFRNAIYRHPNIADTGFLDAEGYILAAKENNQKVFWERDTHWTPDGTLDLAYALMDALDPQRKRPRYAPAPPRLKTAPRVLDLEAMAGYSETQEPEAMMIDIPPSHEGFLTVRLPESEVSPVRGQFSTWDVEGMPEAPQGRLVIIGDSFGDAILEHLRVSYSEIVRLHHGAHYFDVSLEDILAENPDAVLFAIAERQAAQKRQPVQPFTQD